MSAWCRECSNETKLVPPENAAILTGVSAREIYRGVELGHIHCTEFSQGCLLICLNSVAHKLSPDETTYSNHLIRRQQDEEQEKA